MGARPRLSRRAVMRARLQMAWIGLRAFASSKHPILAHVVPTRRCNLACAYCNEYDDHSPPVPVEEMLRRVDALAELGTSIVCFSGGEPMLHPALNRLVRHVRGRGMFAELLTNGYLLTDDRIDALNDAGLNRLQISVDNVQPDEVSMKSLKVLDKKLLSLARRARFDVNINSVLGAGANPDDALTVARRARELGFSNTVGIIHDGSGQLRALGEAEHRAYVEIRSHASALFSMFTQFQENLVQGKPNRWSCRAGARYLYVCEDGLVHHCSQQRGRPGAPLQSYTRAHLREAFDAPKPCAPYCTVSCVHSLAPFDRLRGPQSNEPTLAPGGLVRLRTRHRR